MLLFCSNGENCNSLIPDSGSYQNTPKITEASPHFSCFFSKRSGTHRMVVTSQALRQDLKLPNSIVFFHKSRHKQLRFQNFISTKCWGYHPCLGVKPLKGAEKPLKKKTDLILRPKKWRLLLSIKIPKQQQQHLDVTKNRGTPKWINFIMKNLIRMDDLGGKPTIFGNIHFFNDSYCSW